MTFNGADINDITEQEKTNIKDEVKTTFSDELNVPQENIFIELYQGSIKVNVIIILSGKINENNNIILEFYEEITNLENITQNMVEVFVKRAHSLYACSSG